MSRDLLGEELLSTISIITAASGEGEELAAAWEWL
jgi:hypothetical protein